MLFVISLLLIAISFTAVTISMVFVIATYGECGASALKISIILAFLMIALFFIAINVTQ